MTVPPQVDSDIALIFINDAEFPVGGRKKFILQSMRIVFV